MNKILDSKQYKNDLLLTITKNDFSFLASKKILIIGGFGLIGSSIVDIILMSNAVSKTNAKIYVADLSSKLDSTRFGNGDYVRLLNYDALQQISFVDNFDYVIYCAGIANPFLYLEKPVETILSNFDGVKNMLFYCLKHNVEKFLFVSSSEVYGGKDNHLPFKEDNYGVISIDSVRSSYPISKKATEVLCKSFFAEYGLKTYIVRPGHIYGPTSSEFDTRVSSLFCWNAAKHQDIILKSDGKQQRSYCYSLDCASAILFLIKNGSPGESYNIGSKYPISIFEMANFISKYSGVPLSINKKLDLNKEINNPMDISSLDSSKILSLGYQYLFDPFDGFRHTIDILSYILNDEYGK